MTTRPIPPEKVTGHREEPHNARGDAEAEQPQTINPSLLSRSTDAGSSNVSTKRRLFENAAGRRMPAQVQHQDNAVQRSKPNKNTDVLHRAREMGKRIWSLEKLQKVLDMLVEQDPYRCAAISYASQGSVTKVGGGGGGARSAEESTLLQLLHKERVSGPSDRDPTVATRELVYFKGPYIYIYDIEEKQKPMMVREYARVADKKDGDWPQFRTSATGRCPFVEDLEQQLERKAEKKRTKESATQAAATAAAAAAAAPTASADQVIPKLQPPDIPPPKPVTGKRTLAEMQNGHNTRSTVNNLGATEIFNAAKGPVPPKVDFQPQNAFTSRAKAGRFFAGEPVASGVQPSGITSAIRSQMISSATGTLGAKAGTSKEIHGLQRKVLQRSTSNSQDHSSRMLAEMDHPNLTRSASLGKPVQLKLDMIEERGGVAAEEKHKRTMSVPVPPTKQQKKRDPKPGYCENCQDKFDDFDDVSTETKRLSRYIPWRREGTQLTGSHSISSRGSTASMRRMTKTGSNWTPCSAI